MSGASSSSSAPPAAGQVPVRHSEVTNDSGRASAFHVHAPIRSSVSCTLRPNRDACSECARSWRHAALELIRSRRHRSTRHEGGIDEHEQRALSVRPSRPEVLCFVKLGCAAGKLVCWTSLFPFSDYAMSPNSHYRSTALIPKASLTLLPGTRLCIR